MTKTCLVDACERPIRCVELCSLHYDRKIRQGDNFDRSVNKKGIPRKNSICLHCTGKVARIGLCWRHYADTQKTPCIDCGELSTKNRKRCKSCHDMLTSPKGGTKKCNYCKKEKLEQEFGVRYDTQRRKKLRSRCRDCETNVRTKVKTTDIISKYGTLCHICNEEIDMSAPRKVGIDGWEKGFHREHVISLSKGGENTLENCRPSHGICNMTKSNS